MDDALVALSPGSDVDLRGTTVTSKLLGQLLAAVTPNDPNTRPVLGDARFEGAQFNGDARFEGVQFGGDARFEEAQFNGCAWFHGVQFGGDAGFANAHFSDYARFDGAHFSGDARFGRVRFSGNARFDAAHFSGNARFDEAQFSMSAGFDEAQFDGDARFDEAQFDWSAEFADTRFSREAGFTGAQFNGLYARFDGVQFGGDARFEEAQFGADARFGGSVRSAGPLNGYFRFGGSAGLDGTRGARFSGYAGFLGAQFGGHAWFGGVQFGGDAEFLGVQFGRGAWFDEVQFSGYARFEAARFDEDAWFRRVQFSGDAEFGMVQCRDAEFDEARFEGMWFGPLVCRGRLSADYAIAARAVRLQVAAATVSLRGARFAAPAVFSVRYGAVDLTDVAADAPLTVAFHHFPFTTRAGTQMDESSLSGQARAKLTSLAGVDAANLVLADVDLSRCVFSRAHHLDQIRLEGRCLFAEVPRGWQRAGVRVRRWTRRKVLAEEAAWRADPTRPALASAGWSNPGNPHDPVAAPSPAQLAALYRQLRKALEGGKDTPGAADFYYGEMEARRHDTEGTPRAERALLHAYWLLSGYALRASRALGFLAATATATFLLMMTIGLPDNQLNPQITGTQPAPGGHVALTQSTPDPALTLPLNQRFTADRADKAGLVVVNSVIFRSTGTTLTGHGTWIEIISRIGEPVLLGFAAVAARGRVQR